MSTVDSTRPGCSNRPNGTFRSPRAGGPLNSGAGPVTVNGRTCRGIAAPTVVVCIDGCDSDYLTAATSGLEPRRRRRNSDAFELALNHR
jgi:hypothetical protein